MPFAYRRRPRYRFKVPAMPFRFRPWRTFLAVSVLLIVYTQVAIVTSAQPTPQILINEFMPRPSSGSEWVELFNPNPVDIDLGGWKIDDNTISAPQTAIGAGIVIPANGLLLISLTGMLSYWLARSLGARARA